MVAEIILQPCLPQQPPTLVAPGHSLAETTNPDCLVLIKCHRDGGIHRARTDTDSFLLYSPT